MKKIITMLLVIVISSTVVNEGVYAGEVEANTEIEQINLLEQPYYIKHTDGTIEEFSNKTRLTMAYPRLRPGESLVWQPLPLYGGYNFYSFKWDTTANFQIEVLPNLIADPIHNIHIKNQVGYSGSFHYGQSGSITLQVTNESSSYRTLVSAMFNGR